MNANYIIRPATIDDAAGLLAVYKPYVESTAITFEYEVPSVEEFEGRINTITPEFPWLVCEHEDTIAGYAYAHKHRDRTAYQWSPESTIYLSEAYHGKGIARVLYEAVFAILKMQGFINVYAGVLASNLKSNAFHKAMGFEEIGLYRNIGYKLGEWHSNYWYQLHILPHVINPPVPKRMADIAGTEVFKQILITANLQVNQPASVS